MTPHRVLERPVVVSQLQPARRIPLTYSSTGHAVALPWRREQRFWMSCGRNSV